jgi:FkbM family methyltransferase
MGGAVDLLKSWTRPLRHAIARSIYRSPALEEGAFYSFSAFGEDRVALGWLSAAGVKTEDIRYLDIGASHPVTLSNTMLMYQAGASGVLVEPDARMAESLRARRWRDAVIEAAVAFDQRRSARVIQLSSSVFNTFSEAQAEQVVQSSIGWGSPQTIVGRTDVKLIPIDTIIEQHLGAVAPHFLSIDAEGVDFEILQSLALHRFRPWLICAEKSRPVPQFDALVRPHGYRLVCETPHNMLFALDAAFPDAANDAVRP